MNGDLVLPFEYFQNRRSRQRYKSSPGLTGPLIPPSSASTKTAPPKPPRPGHVFVTDICTPDPQVDIGISLGVARRSPSDGTVLVKKRDYAKYEQMISHGAGRYLIVQGVIPGSPIGHNGRIKSGDEILEVNGQPLGQLSLPQVRSVTRAISQTLSNLVINF